MSGTGLRAVAAWEWVIIAGLVALAAFQVPLVVRSLHAQASLGDDMQPPERVFSTSDKRAQEEVVRVLRTMSEPGFFALVRQLCDPGPNTLDEAQAARILALVGARDADAEQVRQALARAVLPVLRADQVEYLRMHPGQPATSTETDPTLAAAISELGKIAAIDPAKVSPELEVTSSMDRQLGGAGGLGPEQLSSGLLSVRMAPPALALSPAQAARLLPPFMGYYGYVRRAFEMRAGIFDVLDARQKQDFLAAARQQREASRAGTAPPWISTRALTDALMLRADGCDVDGP